MKKLKKSKIHKNKVIFQSNIKYQCISELNNSIITKKYLFPDLKVIHKRSHTGQDILFDITYFYGNRFKKIHSQILHKFDYNTQDLLIKEKIYHYSSNICTEVSENIYEYDLLGSLYKLSRTFSDNKDYSVVSKIYKNEYDNNNRLTKVYRHKELFYKIDSQKVEYKDINLLKCEKEYQHNVILTNVFDYFGNLIYVEKQYTINEEYTKKVYLYGNYLSYTIIKKKLNNAFQYVFYNPAGGEYRWKITDYYNMEYSESFNCRIKILEPILTSDMFEEMVCYLNENYTAVTVMELYGSFFAVSQFDAAKISQIANRKGIRYYFV